MYKFIENNITREHFAESKGLGKAYLKWVLTYKLGCNNLSEVKLHKSDSHLYLLNPCFKSKLNFLVLFETAEFEISHLINELKISCDVLTGYDGLWTKL